MDGLKQQKAIAEKQIEKIKANISGLDRTISNIQAKKGITPKTTKHIEDHLKIISAKKRKIKDLITKIGDIKVGMKMQYTMNREQREREKIEREQQKREREQQKREREQRKSSRPVLVKSSNKPMPKPTPSKETRQLSNTLDALRSSKNMGAQPLSFNELISSTTNLQPKNQAQNNRPSNSPARPARRDRPALSAREEFKFKMFNLIDSKSVNIQIDIDPEMKQSIDRLYKTAIFRIVDDTDSALLKNKKSIQIKKTKQLILILRH